MSSKGHSRGEFKKLIKTIKNDGWYEIPSNTGHLQFKHPTKPGKVTIPHKITKNIELSVMRQAGLRRNNHKLEGK